MIYIYLFFQFLNQVYFKITYMIFNCIRFFGNMAKDICDYLMRYLV